MRVVAERFPADRTAAFLRARAPAAEPVRRGEASPCSVAPEVLVLTFVFASSKSRASQQNAGIGKSGAFVISRKFGLVMVGVGLLRLGRCKIGRASCRERV